MDATPTLLELVEEHERAAGEAAEVRGRIADRGLDGAASGPEAKRVLLVGAEALEPRMRAELAAALLRDEGDEKTAPRRGGNKWS